MQVLSRVPYPRILEGIRYVWWHCSMFKENNMFRVQELSGFRRIGSYFEALELVANHRSAQLVQKHLGDDAYALRINTWKINANSRLEYHPGSYESGGVMLGRVECYYHDTPVVTWYEDNSFTLDTGGWVTPSTMMRMTQYCSIINVSGSSPIDVGLFTSAKARQKGFTIRHDRALGQFIFTDTLHVSADGETTGYDIAVYREGRTYLGIGDNEEEVYYTVPEEVPQDEYYPDTTNRGD